MQVGTKLSVLALLALGCVAQSNAQDTSPAGLGATKEDAIEVCKPRGEREYLARLICPGGAHPEFERIGSVGLRNEFPADMSEEDRSRVIMATMGFGPATHSPVDYHMVDGYSVQCGTAETTLYLDMYHCEVPPPDRAPSGFSIIR